MGMFSIRKPRAFHHQLIYTDERKERLREMEEKAKRDLGMLPEKEIDPRDIKGTFINGTTHLRRKKENSRKPIHVGLIICIIVLLLLIWYYLQTGNWSVF